MAKYAASPRNDIRGSPSSVGWESDGGTLLAAADEEGRAAALPSEPWNWVDFEPQPTLMNSSETRRHQQGGRPLRMNLDPPSPKSSVRSGSSWIVSNARVMHTKLSSPKIQLVNSSNQVST